MSKFVNIGRARGLFVLVLASTCLWGTNAYAGADEDAVKAAVAGYHAALNTLDPVKFEAFWVHDDSVTNIQPRDKTIAVGWDAVKKDMEGNNAAFAELKVVQAEGPFVQIKGDVARSMGIAASTFKLKDGKELSGRVFETDSFEKHDGAWLLVSHSALRVPE